MNISNLLSLIEKDIKQLEQDANNESKRIDEIKKIEEIITIIQNNPYNLYDLNKDSINYVIKAIGLSKEQLAKLEQCHRIYEIGLQYGYENVPQIADVNAFILKIKEGLEDKKDTLTDELCECQYQVARYKNLLLLKEELTSEDKFLSNLPLLFDYLAEKEISLKDKVALKGEINTKNNEIYNKTVQNKAVMNSLKYEEEINEIEEKLSQQFPPTTLNMLKSVAELLSKCSTSEELASLINDWWVCFDLEHQSKLINGLIDLKNIEKLVIKSVSSSDDKEYKEDIDKVQMQVSFLRDYLETLKVNDELENEALVVELLDESDNKNIKLQQYLGNFESDSQLTPNCVLFISDAIDRDIKAIDDRETLEDAFILIEQLKNDDLNTTVNLSGNNKLVDLREIKPRSLGRQARVIYANITDNIYGILCIFGKKANNPRRIREMVENRRKQINIEKIRTSIKEPEVLDRYLERSKTVSETLRKLVTGEKETSKIMEVRN